MTNFQKSLDRYLTSEPEDGFTEYGELVDDLLDKLTWDKIEQKAPEHWTDFGGAIVEVCFDNRVEPTVCAKIIDKLYKNF